MRTLDDAVRAKSASSIDRLEVVPSEATRLSASSMMLLSIARTGKHLYEGTVPHHVKSRRRAANKRARHARRVHRR